jgi:D-methionine transport system substrate-binding protein
MLKKSILIFVLVTFLFAGAVQADDHVLKVGATPVPHAEILEFIKDDLAAEGIELDIVEFTDYVTPNLALDDGSIDANYFQHIPYLNQFNSDRDLNLKSVIKVQIWRKSLRVLQLLYQMIHQMKVELYSCFIIRELLL